MLGGYPVLVSIPIFDFLAGKPERFPDGYPPIFISVAAMISQSVNKKFSKHRIIFFSRGAGGGNNDTARSGKQCAERITGAGRIYQDNILLGEGL